VIDLRLKQKIAYFNKTESARRTAVKDKVSALIPHGLTTTIFPICPQREDISIKELNSRILSAVFIRKYL
jgi:hypothetical protein